jgi:hypothetical protein
MPYHKLVIGQNTSATGVHQLVKGKNTSAADFSGASESLFHPSSGFFREITYQICIGATAIQKGED